MVIGLSVVSPFAPMRRLDVDILFSRNIDPSNSAFTAWAHQRVNSTTVRYADFKVAVGWRS